MSKTDTMFIAFPHGGILPAEIAGGKDRPVGPHDPVRVPSTYGKSLVEDRFAYIAEPPRKASAAQPKPSAIDELEARLETARKAVGGASDLEQKGRLEAEVSSIEAEIAALKSA